MIKGLFNAVLLVAVAFAALLALPVMAKIGVGVGTGSIRVSEPLKAGKAYTLPPIVVLNTGDETSEYNVRLAYRENQPELKPDESWFRFEPSTFNLAPGESKLVQVFTDLPIKGALPGDYFAFLQARPIVVPQAGVASVGVAAASQLRFTIEPSNVFQAMFYSFSDWYSKHHPLNTIILVVVGAALLLVFIKKKFKIQVARR